jgi:tetratricopeptide (TPR) repeat protein
MGPASDVFSLGAVLYRVLTGRPPFTGPDVEAVLRVAQRAQFDGARKVAPRAPPPLEAVCNKAMRLAPADRYPSAKALAEDVRRYLADEPVGADREPIAERLWRRARRHHTLATTAAALMLACGVALLAGLWAVNREKTNTAKARDEAVAAAERADQNERRAVEAQEEAKANLARAEGNLELARKAIDDYFAIARNDPLLQQPATASVKKRLLEKALPFYESFRAQKPADASLQAEHARLWQQIAYINQALQRNRQAIEAYRESIALWRAWLKARPDDLASRRELAGIHNNLASLVYYQGDLDAALAEYRESLAMRQKMADARPDVPEHQKDLADTHNNLGVLLGSLGRNDEALKQHRLALKIQTALCEKHRTRGVFWRDLASGYNNLAAALDAVDDKEAAVAAYRKSIDVLVRLLDEYPTAGDFLLVMLRSRGNLALTLSERGQKREAAEEFDRALEVGAKLAREHPDDPEAVFQFSGTLANAAGFLREVGDRAEVLKLYDHARALRKQLVKRFPEVGAYQEALAVAHLDVGEWLGEVGKHDGAMVEFQEAIRILGRRIASRPTADNLSRLARAHVKRGEVLAQAAKLRDALADLDRGLDLVEKLREKAPRHPGVSANLLDGLTSRAEVRARLGQSLDADADRERALASAPKEKRRGVRLMRARGRALAGDHVRSAAEADAEGRAALAGPNLLTLASVYSLNSAAAAKDASLDAGERAKLAEAYAAKAVATLKRAATAGHFADARKVRLLDADRDLDAVRGRDDYQAFRKALKAE